ncbi:MAG TPA: anthranilate phosphoribosyltransferase [Acidimicrobiales bacterium]|jgi:anthranilate phosphoribosyltransferase|nr:anthranilate phosphoribosyltransferase [Acidimicrobiales bacterium]
MVTLSDLGGWPGVLSRIAGRGDLSADEAAAALADVLEGNATPSQMAAFIFGLRCKGETVEEMTGLVRAMVATAEGIDLDEELRSTLVDTCGTGGDRSGTINVSTIAALVVAGAGVRVCKHGNRAASSKAGSADVLEALGVVIDLGPRGVARCVTEAGIGFCFAPRFHANLRYAGPTRRELGVPTAFNFLGPLANPAGVRRQVVGVGDPTMALKMAGVLGANGAVHALVVYGHDGLDELSTTGPSTVVEWRSDVPDGVKTYVVEPAELGLSLASPGELKGGDAATNADLARRVLDAERGPHRDIVLLNAAAALVAGGAAAHLAEGLVLAAEAIDAGRAAATLEHLIAVSQAAAGA